MRTEDRAERAHERREEQPGDAAVQAIRKARAVALAKVEAERGICDRVAEPGEERAVIGEDVAIMHRDDAGEVGCEQVAEAQPEIASLAGFAHGEVTGAELREEFFEARAVVPEQMNPRCKGSEGFPCAAPAGGIDPVEANNDLREIRRVAELGDDVGEGRRAEFADVARERERDGTLRREARQLLLEPGEIGLAQSMQRGHRAVLEKIRHEREGIRLCVPKLNPQGSRPMNPAFRHIGFVSTRFAGTDGVSFEAGKWARLFAEDGAECFWFAGQLDTPSAASHLAPEAFFNHPSVLEIQTGLFGVTERTPEITRRVEEMTARLGAELRAFIARFGIDLLVVQNALAIPMHVPLGLALAEVITETGLPTIAHHHDFAWERERFAVNACADYLDETFPPRVAGMAHVVINSRQRAALAERFDLAATIIPNVLDFETSPPVPDEYARGFRNDIGVAEDETLVLQPTRIIARKGITHSVELTRRLADRRAVLVLTHPAGDEGMEVLREVEAGIARAGIRAIFLSGRIDQTRGIAADGRRIYTLADVYPHADFVTYPSTWEGFGNALLEAVYFGRPVLVNRYPVYVSDIAPTGLRVVEMDGVVTDAIVAEVRAVLDDSARQREWARANAAIGRKHFSMTLARDRLAGICTTLSRRLATPGGGS